MRENNAKLEVANNENQKTIDKMAEDAVRLNALTDQLGEDLQKAEQYGDELRATLNKHNLTHLANKILCSKTWWYDRKEDARCDR